jgi:hypothetical protein
VKPLFQLKIKWKDYLNRKQSFRCNHYFSWKSSENIFSTETNLSAKTNL